MGISSFETVDKPFAKQVQQVKLITLDSTTVDARSTVTTDLLPGLLLGEIGASGVYAMYIAGAGDGTETADYILMESIDMIEGGKVAVDTPAIVMAIGVALSAHCGGKDAPAVVDLAKAGTGAGFITFE